MRAVARAAAVAFSLLVGALTSLAAAPARADAGPPGLAEAAREARRARLAETSEWRRLVHAHPTASNGWESEPDGPAFYVSPRGRFDPEAELFATLAALYADPARGDKHALCKFPARARFLAEVLALRGLPSPRCEARDELFARLRPRRVVFVFSSYHVDSPASAFGHVLLRIERDDRGLLRPDAPRHPLADIGVDYSADVGSENAVTYALKGLFGQFPGTFKALPYAAKVREYQDYESRDLWEYELDLTEDEKRAFLEHLWELSGTSFDYFYLSENCAYHVIALLDVVRPSAGLLARMGSPALPTDALRAVWEAPGLVSRVRYRPSLRTVALARLGALAPAHRALARSLAAGERQDAALAALPEDARRDVLDAALDLLDLEHHELLESPDDDSPARQQKLRLAMARAAVPGESPELHIAPPPSAAPHLGHDARRVGLGVGYASAGGAFLEARARLTLHDTLDRADGLPELASVEALAVTARAYPRPRSLELESLTVVRFEKLAPWTAAERGLSYRLFVGGARARDDGCASCLVARVDGGVGLALRPEASTVLYARADGALDAADGLWGLDRRGFRLALGPTAGARVALGARAALLGEARLAWLPGAPAPVTASAVFEARLSLSRSVALGVFARRQLVAADLGVSSLIYF